MIAEPVKQSSSKDQAWAATPSGASVNYAPYLALASDAADSAYVAYPEGYTTVKYVWSRVGAPVTVANWVEPSAAEPLPS